MRPVGGGPVGGEGGRWRERQCRPGSGGWGGGGGVVGGVTCVDNVMPVGVGGAGYGVGNKLEARARYNARQEVVYFLQQGIIVALKEFPHCALHEQAVHIGVMEAG